MIRNAISATGPGTTVTTARFEQNMIGLALKKSSALVIKKKKSKQANKRNGQREEKSHLVLLLTSLPVDGMWRILNCSWH